MTINGSDDMASKESLGKPEARFLKVLRAAALIALLVGAVGSVGLMLREGHRNPSRLLIVLFTFWVLSPFMALVLANDALCRDVGHHVWLLGYLRCSCLRTLEGEDRVRIPCCSCGVMAAYRDSCHDSRANIWQAVTSR